MELLESSEALKVPPISPIGSVTEIMQSFGGVSDYKAALQDLQRQLYR